MNLRHLGKLAFGLMCFLYVAIVVFDNMILVYIGFIIALIVL